MKKLLTCLFTLLMAVAILSPVRMSAATVEVDVTFEVDDNDFYTKVDDQTVTANGSASAAQAVEALLVTKDNMLGYDGDLDYVGSDLWKVKVTAEIFVASSNGTSRVWGEKEYGVDPLGNALTNANLKDGDEVIVLFHTVIDYYGEGDVYDAKDASYGNPDKIDDREQTVVTIEQETWSDIKGAGTGKYTTVQYVTDGTEDQLVELIKDLPEYDETHRVGSGKDRKTYRLVYDINGDEVTAEWDVRPDKDEDRFGEIKSSTPENSLDKDGDGVVTCDEYYGVTGLKWDATKNACVTTSGNAVVTVPNTSAR